MQGETLPVLICYKSPESSTPFIRTMSEMEHCTVYFFKLTILTNHVLGFQTKEHINNIKLLKINLLISLIDILFTLDYPSYGGTVLYI